MPTAFLTLPVNDRGRIGILSQDDSESMRNAARNAANGIDVQLGNISYRIFYLSHFDIFTVHHRAERKMYSSVWTYITIIENARKIEIHLNHGKTLSYALESV